MMKHFIKATFVSLLSLFITSNVWADPKKILNGTLTYRGVTIQEDPIGAVSGQYIDPNEKENYLQLRCINPSASGALVSVGTFRALNVAALASPTAIFQFDFDIVTIFFNHLNRALILRSKNRFEYLSYLLTGKLQKKLIRDVQSGKLKECDFFDALSQKGTATEPTDYFQNLRKLKLDLPRLSDQYADQLTRQHEKLQNSKVGFNYSTDLLLFLYTHRNWFYKDFRSLSFFFHSSQEVLENAFFGSDLLFDRLQKMIQEDRLHILSLNLLGDQGFSSLRDALRNTGQTVKILDTSNAHQWIVDTYRKSVPQIKKYFDNILHLPFSKDSRVFMTDDSEVGGWDYFVFDPDYFSLFYGIYSNFYREADPNERSSPPPLSLVQIAGYNTPKLVHQYPTGLFAQPRELCPPE